MEEKQLRVGTYERVSGLDLGNYPSKIVVHKIMNVLALATYFYDGASNQPHEKYIDAVLDLINGRRAGRVLGVFYRFVE